MILKKRSPSGESLTGRTTAVGQLRPSDVQLRTAHELVNLNQRLRDTRPALEDDYSPSTLERLRTFCACGKVGIYFAAGRSFCSKHRSEAIEANREFKRRKYGP